MVESLSVQLYYNYKSYTTPNWCILQGDEWSLVMTDDISHKHARETGLQSTELRPPGQWRTIKWINHWNFNLIPEDLYVTVSWNASNYNALFVLFLFPLQLSGSSSMLHAFNTILLTRLRLRKWFHLPQVLLPVRCCAMHWMNAMKPAFNAL